MKSKSQAVADDVSEKSQRSDTENRKVFLRIPTRIVALPKILEL